MIKYLQNIYNYLYINYSGIFIFTFIVGWQLSEIIISSEYKDKIFCEKEIIISISDWLIVKSFISTMIILFSGVVLFSDSKNIIYTVSRQSINFLCFFYLLWLISYCFILNTYCKDLKPYEIYVYLVFSFIYGFIFTFKVLKKFTFKKKENIPLLDPFKQ